jgi:flagellar biosynthesis protein FlhB
MKPLYRPDSTATAPQSRFPQPSSPESQPGDSSPAKLEETAGPSTAVLPAVVAAAPTGAPVAVKSAESAAAAKARAGNARRTRKARLRLSRLDPWSVMKTSFLFSIAAGIMLVVAVYVIWTVLSTSGLFDSVNEIVASVVSTPGDTTPFRIEEYINTQKVMGVSALIACVDVVIFTALATLGSFLYNLAATMLGGLEITLAED